MNKWTLGYGSPNYTVRLSEVPLWRVVVEESYLEMLDRLGHPCCWSLKWVPGERLRDWVAVVQFKLLNNRLSFAASGNHEKRVESVEISEQQAYEIAPEFVADMRDVFDDEPEPATATFTNSTATNLTWTSTIPNTTIKD